MEFRLLGPVEVVDERGTRTLGGTKIRTLLAALLLAPGRVIALERLVDIIWDDDPPPTARALIQTYISALRRAIGDAGTEIIRTQPPGYLARIPDGSLDRDRFEDFVAQGKAAADDGRYREASNAFRAADTLWHGPALGGVRSRILATEAARLDEQRIAVIELRTAADLELGRTEELIGELTVLVGQHPTRPELRGHLMLALYRAGRTADALTVFRQGRQALLDELGIEPGVELTRLHEAILRSAPELLGPRPAAPAVPPPAQPEPVAAGEPRFPVPRQLPPDAADFTGREDLVRELVDLLTGGRTGPVVAALLGPGGAGKSALAAHVAHRVSSAYPDGQLHVDLRGTTSTPASPAEVLGRFLRALQPNENAIPDEADERMDAYRTLLSDRRMLIVLDDAATEQQVRPLLPGTGTCSVLVTSRNRLAGLAGAHLVEVDMLSADEATALLARIAGADRIMAAPDAATDIVASCGNLPLAVRVAGARLATRRQWTPRLLANRLIDERRRLDELSAGDQRIRASIEMSVRSLEPAARTAIRRLGHLGLADFRAWVVAYALDVDVDVAERVIEHLVDTHLVDYTFIDDTGQVRYRLHDLVRIYAREEAEQHESRDDLVASTARVVGGWAAVLDRLREHIVDHVTSGAIHLAAQAIPAGDNVDAEVNADVLGTALADPRGWLDIEQSSLVLAVERAAEMGLDELAVAVASVLCASTYALNSVLDLWDRAHRTAQAAAKAAGNAHGEAILLAELGQLRYEQDRFADARQHLTDAVERFRDLRDPRGEASALSALGLACREQGYLPEAEHFLAQASVVCRGLDDDRATGHCRRLIGSVHLECGDFHAADTALAEALTAYRRAGSRRGEALTLRTIGLTHRARGRLTEAEDAFAAALVLFRDLGDTKLAAFCQRGLAKTYVRMGRLDEAREHLDIALAAHRAERDTWAEAMVMRTLGELGLAAGRLDDASHWLGCALKTFRAQDATLFCARTLRDIARLEQSRGDDAAAKAALAEALETFRTYGSREYDELTTGADLPL